MINKCSSVFWVFTSAVQTAWAVMFYNWEGELSRAKSYNRGPILVSVGVISPSHKTSKYQIRTRGRMHKITKKRWALCQHLGNIFAGSINRLSILMDRMHCSNLTGNCPYASKYSSFRNPANILAVSKRFMGRNWLEHENKEPSNTGMSHDNFVSSDYGKNREGMLYDHNSKWRIKEGPTCRRICWR